MKKTILYFLLISLPLSCTQNLVTYEKIEFVNPYKFNSDIEDKVLRDTLEWKYQISASEYASKGYHKKALEHWDLAFKPNVKEFSKSKVDSIKRKFKISPAKDYILERAKENKVIIINEAHHNSFHRVFTKSLLQDLYNLGYKNLGLEALSNGKYKDSLLLERKYPSRISGYYIKNPYFGEMIRSALKIGYNVFPYEQTSSNRKLREIEQACNIKRLIEKYPNQKFIIHCGFDHALEGTSKYNNKSMAQILNDSTGIDPLTINQVAYSERSKDSFNNPLLKVYELEEPSVLLDITENKPLTYKRGKNWTDIAVLHPNTTYNNDTPDWRISKKTKKVFIELNSISISFPIMILAYKHGEDIQTTIPIYIKEIEDKVKEIELFLDSGKYQLVITNKEKQSFKMQVQTD